MENVGKSSDERSFASCCVSARARSQGDHSGSIFGITEKTASQKKYSPQAHSFNYVYLRARLLFIFDTRALASVCVCVTCRLNLFISQNHKITKSQHMLHTLYTLETKSNRPHKKLVSDSYWPRWTCGNRNWQPKTKKPNSAHKLIIFYNSYRPEVWSLRYTGNSVSIIKSFLMPKGAYLFRGRPISSASNRTTQICS